MPDLAYGTGDTTSIRVRTTSHPPPHALYVITAGELTPYTSADNAFARLRPILEAAARSREGCGAEAGVPCNPNRLSDPSST
ncbi:hypothetical protein [Streptomyces sp. NPDC056527]|uniref:hypothetical protein n=1 Tax=Streptomyces sp. NPDC056527 TaxID=3345853 RepID=UPI0036837871